MELESLPEGWELKGLGEITRIEGGGTPNTRIKEYYKGNIPFVIPSDLSPLKNFFISAKDIQRRITTEAIEKSSTKLLPPGTVLMSSRATIGLIAIPDFPVCTNQGFKNFICGKELNNLYLAYYLKSIKEKIEGLAGSTTFKEVSKRTIQNLEIPLPPLEEQKKIVEILQFADYLKERRREAIKLIDKIVMSVFYDMFGDPATNPRGWEIERLDKICNFDTYQILPDARREYFYLGLEDIESNTGKIIKNTKTLGSKILSNKHNFDNSHVLYGKLRPYLNKVAMPMQEGICSTDIIPLKPDENYLMREFLVYYLRDKNFIKWAAEHSTGTKMPRIQTSTLKKHQIPLPPLDLQQEFAEIVSKLEDKRKKMEEAEEKLEMLYQILLKQAFTGKLTEEWRMRGNASKCR